MGIVGFAIRPSFGLDSGATCVESVDPRSYIRAKIRTKIRTKTRAL